MPTKKQKTEKKELQAAPQEQADTVTLTREELDAHINAVLAEKQAAVMPPPPPAPVQPDPRQCPACAQPGALGYQESKDAVVCGYCDYERPLNPDASKSWFQKRREKVAAERAQRKPSAFGKKRSAPRMNDKEFMAERIACDRQTIEVQLALVEQVARMANAMEHIALGLNPELGGDENDAS